MPEFRTEVPGTKTPDTSSGGSADFGKHIDRIIENIKNDPESQAKIAQGIQEQYNIPPEVLGGIFPSAMDNPQVPEKESTPTPTGGNDGAKTEVRKVTEKPDPEQVIEFVGELLGYVEDDMTISELHEYMKENKGIVDTAIKMKF